MSEYIKELEAQIESLKVALDKERDWNDYTIKRKESQKYRRWCFSYIVKFHGIPPDIAKKIPLQYCWTDEVYHNLDDMRSVLRNHLEGIDSYFSVELPKICKKIKNSKKIDPHTINCLNIYLYDQKKDKKVYSKDITFDIRSYGVNLIKISNIVGLEPRQIQIVDEFILPLILEGDEYVNKWYESAPR